MKKKIIAFCLSLMSIGANSQNILTGHANIESDNLLGSLPCRTATPPKEWDEWFNNKVEEFKRNNSHNKIQSTYTIPVIVHIIHTLGIPVGFKENISQAQVQSQITVLNNVFSGKGVGTIPSVFQSVNAGDIGIQFCLVKKDPSGNTLAEPGIERINWTTRGWKNPSNLAFDSIYALFQNTIKPSTIWDPTKYLNIWITDESIQNYGSYANFPSGTGMSGFNNSSSESATTSGIVFYHRMFGTNGSTMAPYLNGISAVHEVGHYLGLRHIWGDAECGNDFCSDTPPHTGGHNNTSSSANRGCPPAGWKGKNGLCSGNNYGEEMFMNYMDYTLDGCANMFSAEQKTRMLTALTFGTYRKFLGMDGFCNTSLTAPIANYTYPFNICNKNTGYTFSDASQNMATSWFWSVTPAAGVNINSPNSQNPTISFTTPGTYQLTLKATNSMGNSTETKSIAVKDCIEFMCDTLNNNNKNGGYYYLIDKAKPIDSGFYFGVNYMKDKAIAEMYANTSSTKKLKGISTMFLIVDQLNSTASYNVTLNVWNDINGQPGNVIASMSIPRNSITQGYFQTIEFPSPITITGKFYIGFEWPQVMGITSVGNDKGDPNTGMANCGWLKDKNDQWISYTQYLGSQYKLSNSIFPIFCESSQTAGVDETNTFELNSVYPNPSSGQIHFQFATAKNIEIDFSIFNALGQNMLEGKKNLAGSNELELNLSQLPKGVYFIRLTDNDKNIFGFKKFILE